MPKKEDASPYTAHVGYHAKRRNNGAPAPVNDRAARQHSRYASLKAQFNKCARQLVGRTAVIVLPGLGCNHSAEQFRPVHWERRWRARPFFVLLSVGREEEQKRFTLKLTGATSFFDESAKKLRYVNGSGAKPCLYDYLRPPMRGGQAPVLDGSANHVLFTAANNLLQELVNTANQPPQPLVLPKLVCLIEGRHIPIDHKKIERLAESIPEALRAQYKQRRAEEAEIMSLGTRFADAEVLPDAAIVKAFLEKRAYEDYSGMLGAETANPVRKILMAANPASAVLAQNGLEPGWDETASQKVDTDLAADDPERYNQMLAEHQDLYEKLLAEMRSMLPLPEMASDSDLLDALAEPHKQLRLSRALSDLIEKEPGAVIRALRNTMPRGAALREHVTNDELLAAARNPYAPLTVGAYSKIQVVNTEELDTLPSWATGSFWTTEGYRASAQLPVWAGGDEVGIEFEAGDVTTGVVDCAQLKREKIASE